MSDRGGHWVMRQSSRGTPYCVWAFAVPRINDQVLDCVVYLYPDRTRAETGESAGGSGFLVGVALGLGISTPIEPTNDYYAAVVVTNKHVVSHGATTVRVNTKAGGIDIFELDGQHAWLFHPDHDLAIAPIDGLSLDQHSINWLSYPYAFATEDLIQAMKIGPGDECFVVGRFVNHEGKQRNAPSVRFGAIAQMPQEKIKFDDGSEQESFLVEAKSISGYSGSPVFVYIPPFDGSNVGRGNMSWTRGPWLLGIDHCHIHTKQEIIGPKGKPIGNGWHIKENTGMMGVVPAWRLAEMFSFPDMLSFLERQRAEAEKLLATRVDAATGTKDG
jgi:hypothetical protein